SPGRKYTGARDPGVVDDPRVPAAGGDPSILAAHAACVRPSPGKLAAVSPCPAADPLLLASREGLARSTPARPTDAPLGVVRAMGGGWVAMDARVTSAWVYGRAQLGEVSREALDELAGWCRSDRDAELVVELDVGCARVAELGGLPPGASVRLRDVGGTMKRVGAGSFVSERSPETTCAAGAEVVFVRSVSKHEICSTEVWPALLRRGEADLQAYQASPEAVGEPVRALLSDLAESAVALEDLQRRMTSVEAQLAQASLDLAAVRDQVAGMASETDGRFVTLLTRLDMLDADVAETSVSAGSALEHLQAYDGEEAAIAEKAAEPALDGAQVARLGGQLRDLIGRLDALSGDVAAIEARLLRVRESVGYLQGGLLAVQPPQKGPRGR
ncbi:MAG TPA: hypothetical protein PKA64_07760, partial [Myxococcota bacterium]|nr:hypothetical protein [Myxococcota bacterium]